MIPILDNSTTLQGNGLGRLADLLTCSVVHEINGEYELRATYPVTGQRYDDIAEGLIIWATPDNVTARQAFRVYRITKPLNGIITIYARHISYDMSGIIVEPFSASSLQAALTALPSHCVPSCPFTFTTSRSVATTFRVTVPTPLWALLGGQQGSFLDVYGGEWNFNNLTADLASHLGQNRGVSVRYGKNLTELTQDVTVDESYGAVYPYYYDEESGTLVTLPEKYVSVPDAAGDRIMLLDCSGDFDAAPSVAQLQARASAYINANDIGQPKISWKVNFAMLQKVGEYEAQAILEQVQLGDTLSIFYEPLSLTGSSRAVRTEFDVLREEFISVTLGRVKQNLAKIVATTGNEIKTAVAAARSTLEKEIDKATDFIIHGTGVMRFIYNDNDQLQEIVSLDDPDLSEALSVWRWNNGGFGHSANGYNGPYTLALTPDGAINADLITVGTLSAARVRTGLLIDETETNWWNLDTGEFHSATVVNLSDRMTTAEASISNIGGEISIVAQKLNNIGGRNYLKYSNDRSTWRRNFPTSYQPAEIALYSNMVGGKKYTVTIWGDVPTRDGADGYYSVYWGGGSTVLANVHISNGKGSATFTAPTSGAGIGNAWINIYNTADGGGSSHTFTSNITAVKLEEGEVSTDWSAAPEDKTGNNEIIAKINLSPETIVISASKVDLQGYVTFSNLATSGETAINGGNITTNTISADKLNITDLNAIGATIGGFKIETNSVHTNGVAITSNATNSVGLSSSTFTRTINGTSRGNLKFAIGSNFGVASDGSLYASNGNFSGTITSNSATITGGSIDIETSSETQDKITLIYSDGTTTSTSSMTAAAYRSRQVRSTSYYNGIYSSGGATLTYGASSSNITNSVSITPWSTFIYDTSSGGASLSTTGLTFRDANDNVTASYPASGLMSIGKAFYNANTDRTVLSNRTAAILANVVRADFEGFKGFSVRYSGGYYYSYFVINPSKVQGEMVVLEVSPYGNGEISLFTIDGNNTITLKRTI